MPSGDPASSLDAGLALLTNDRLREGILPDFTLTENICLPILSRFAALRRRPRQQGNGGHRRTQHQAFAGTAPGPSALLRQLSGGNQQKVLFAKWLETKPKVFVMDEPTIGVDVGSKAEIRAIIDEIAGTGVGILLVTTELEELVALCDRVLIMFRGGHHRRVQWHRHRPGKYSACLGMRRNPGGGRVTTLSGSRAGPSRESASRLLAEPEAFLQPDPSARRTWPSSSSSCRWLTIASCRR